MWRCCGDFSLVYVSSGAKESVNSTPKGTWEFKSSALSRTFILCSNFLQRNCKHSIRSCFETHDSHSDSASSWVSSQVVLSFVVFDRKINLSPQFIKEYSSVPFIYQSHISRLQKTQVVRIITPQEFNCSVNQTFLDTRSAIPHSSHFGNANKTFEDFAADTP